MNHHRGGGEVPCYLCISYFYTFYFVLFSQNVHPIQDELKYKHAPPHYERCLRSPSYESRAGYLVCRVCCAGLTPLMMEKNTDWENQRCSHWSTVSSWNQWETDATFNSRNGRLMMHFVLKPMENWRKCKSGKCASDRKFVQKPLPNRRNTKNQKGFAGIKIRRQSLDKSTQQDNQWNLPGSTDFVENLKEIRRNCSVQALSFET